MSCHQVWLDQVVDEISSPDPRPILPAAWARVAWQQWSRLELEREVDTAHRPAPTAPPMQAAPTTPPKQAAPTAPPMQAAPSLLLLLCKLKTRSAALRLSRPAPGLSSDSLAVRKAGNKSCCSSSSCLLACLLVFCLFVSYVYLTRHKYDGTRN